MSRGATGRRPEGPRNRRGIENSPVSQHTRGPVGVVDRIEVRSVSRLFGHTVAVRRVSLAFESGVLWFIEGPNGAGKSTLLSLIGTALKPTSGSISYGSLGDAIGLVRPYIGWVAHQTRAYADLTGKENVELVARLNGVDPSASWLRVAERFECGTFADQPVRTLSRGQKQRIALARALVHGPSILLLDEPTSGLDAASSERLERVLLEERARGTLVIVVSHRAGLAERLGGRRVRLERGRVVSID